MGANVPVCLTKRRCRELCGDHASMVMLRESTQRRLGDAKGAVASAFSSSGARYGPISDPFISVESLQTWPS